MIARWLRSTLHHHRHRRRRLPSLLRLHRTRLADGRRSAQRARWVGSEPSVDALHVESVSAPWQQAAALPVLHLREAHRALHRRGRRARTPGAPRRPAAAASPSGQRRWLPRAACPAAARTRWACTGARTARVSTTDTPSAPSAAYRSNLMSPSRLEDSSWVFELDMPGTLASYYRSAKSISCQNSGWRLELFEICGGVRVCSTMWARIYNRTGEYCRPIPPPPMSLSPYTYLLGFGFFCSVRWIKMLSRVQVIWPQGTSPSIFATWSRVMGINLCNENRSKI
jgi:hypothetical protein